MTEPNPSLHIRRMTADDLPAGLRLKEQAGWNQTPADVARFLALQPDGCFVAELDGAPAGTVVVFLFGSVAWIAFVLVDSRLRGRGIGQALMRHALDFADHQGATTVRLDATPLGQPLYEKLGFVAEYQLARYEGVPAAAAAAGLVEPGCMEHLDAIVELDCRASGADRRQLLMRLAQECPEHLRVVEQAGNLRGFLMSRPGSNAWMLGPCVADETAGPALVADSLSRFTGKKVYLDIPLTQHMAIASAERHGLTVQRPLLRMRRGGIPADQPSLIWTSSGPEKG